MASRVYSDLDLNFTKHPVTKDVSIKTKEYAVIAAVKNLINTNYYEKPFRPKFGSNIRKMLFEPIDPLTASILRKEITVLLDNYEPRVRLDAVQVNANEDQHRYDITIRFFLRNISAPIQISLFLNRLR